jgi:F0F1-type ATP synthase assembly protein I
MGEDQQPPPDSDDQRRDPSTANAAWSIVSHLISGLVIWGGLGWLGDRLLHPSGPLLFPIGVLVGAALATYLVVIRHGRA